MDPNDLRQAADHYRELGEPGEAARCLEDLALQVDWEHRPPELRRACELYRQAARLEDVERLQREFLQVCQERCDEGLEAEAQAGRSEHHADRVQRLKRAIRVFRKLVEVASQAGDLLSPSVGQSYRSHHDRLRAALGDEGRRKKSPGETERPERMKIASDELRGDAARRAAQAAAVRAAAAATTLVWRDEPPRPVQPHSDLASRAREMDRLLERQSKLREQLEQLHGRANVQQRHAARRRRRAQSVEAALRRVEEELEALISRHLTSPG